MPGLKTPRGWTLREWREAYASGALTPRRALGELRRALDPADKAWISLADEAQLESQLAALEARWGPAGACRERPPLYGIPFAVKDNIDAAGWRTTAACPAFAYTAAHDAPAVARLREAGAVLIGKTNMDQFATGLVGLRSPYGAVPNAFDPRYVSGGSSAGSAVVVARGWVPFSLGTDTAGSGRVPAAFNNLVGLKPTRGAVSTRGVVPTCRSLDCVSILSLVLEDAQEVTALLQGYDEKDAYSRAAPSGPGGSPGLSRRFGVPRNPRWTGDGPQEAAYRASLAEWGKMGVELVPLDFGPIYEMSDLLYGGPWVAERLAAIEPLLAAQPDAVHPIVRRIITEGRRFSAVEGFKAEYRRVALARVIQESFQGLDALLMPTTPGLPSTAQVEEDPIGANSRLGAYTNFVNLADCCALALPAGFREDGLPFGVMLVAPAWQDGTLAEYGRRWQRHRRWPLGATGRRVPPPPDPPPESPPGMVRLAVAGAHLSGMPLNHQLTDRGAGFVEHAVTAPCYRLVALPDTQPPKPGLVRAREGAAIQVELWDMPLSGFGGFTAAVPPPLGIGTVLLADGREVKGFLCEGWAAEGAPDISAYGGWRAFLEAQGRPAAPPAPFRKVLIANRGEIAVRAARTLRALGVGSVAVYSDADRNSPHVAAADEALPLGGAAPAESYLRIDAVVAAARASGAQAVFPGYGFLSENAEFARRCEAEGLAFIGPTPGQIRDFGLKHEAKRIAREAGLPLAPGSGLLGSLEEARAEAARVGYPVMLKATAGGGGIGLARCDDEASLTAAFGAARRGGLEFFGDGGVVLEKFIQGARHLEVQIFGDGRGRVAVLGERDCSLQRRHQKVVEETPPPRLPEAVRLRMRDAARRLGEAVKYRSAGTVEFVFDPASEEFYFLEVNARLQVEHGITEAVTGLDLVEWMVRLAAGQEFPLEDAPAPGAGAALEARIYAEDPARAFRPSPGTLTEVSFPEGVRVDTWVSAGTEVTPHYDPLLAKVIARGADRAQALGRLREALGALRLAGLETNLDYLRQVVGSDPFAEGDYSTDTLPRFTYRPRALEVLRAGTYTTVQDHPGRVGHWHVGVPPSGPMDGLAFRLANRAVGNPASAAGLECTLEGPRVRFHQDAVAALTGAPAPATLDGRPVPFWEPFPAAAGQVLEVGKVSAGCRTYLAVRGGLDLPDYLGSRSTFVLGGFGGHRGRPLRDGDWIPLPQAQPPGLEAPRPIPAGFIPDYGREWEIGALEGPHGGPEFLKPGSLDMIFSTAWEVHYNSNRLGIRLKGPKPAWTRRDGGEAGLHPSNIHDTQYAVGSLNFTGDMPVLLGQDGPSLGGFVCPLTVVASERWKVGQLKPGDRVRFKRLSFAQAVKDLRTMDKALGPLIPPPRPRRARSAPSYKKGGGLLARLPARGKRPEVAYRQAGDECLLIEYGPNRLDLRLRLRVHLLMRALGRRPLAAVRELSPGVRSLQVRFDPRALSQQALLKALLRVERSLPPVEGIRLPTRVLHLPMAFEDSATLEAVTRYRRSVRDTAPWLPRNAEFIRRINGLKGVEQVRRILFEASYLVLGLGDVYLGAPCAVPLDPRHRLLTSKYNPARTYTAEGAVGIGGVYMCIYGMDSPGGYQLVGRTLPIWNRFPPPGRPHALLRFFDQIRFYPVPEAELAAQREAFREGRFEPRTEEVVFDLAEHEAFLRRHRASIRDFQKRQKAAFAREVARWSSLDRAPEAPPAVPRPAGPQGGGVVRAPLSGKVWKLQARVGQRVRAEEPLAVLEAMKMEFTVGADRAGVVEAVYCRPGSAVSAGDPLFSLQAEGDGGPRL